MKPIIDALSPNHDDRDKKVSLVVLHYTGMETGKDALDRLVDKASKVSAHYLVEEDGQVYRLVPEEKRAWHAGAGGWGPHDNVNAVSVGIEIVNPGHFWGYRDFPVEQIDSVIALLKGIQARHGIAPEGVVGHSDVAPERKDDPGEKFPWDRLAEAGLCLPTVSDPTTTPPEYFDAIRMLQAIGYRLEPTHPVAATLAFQRRFIPSELGQGLSPKTRSAIAEVYSLTCGPTG